MNRDDLLLVKTDLKPPDSGVTEGFFVEAMSFNARFQPGLYVMVPVRNEHEAEELTKRLSAPS